MHFIRILIGITFNKFFGHDRRRLNDWLAFYNLDINFFQEIQFTYDDIQYFIHILSTFINNPCKYNKFKDMINSVAIPDNLEINKYNDYINKFNKALLSRKNIVS